MSPYVLSLITDELTEGIRDEAPGCKMFAGVVISMDENTNVLESKLLEKNRVKMNQYKTELGKWAGGTDSYRMYDLKVDLLMK